MVGVGVATVCALSWRRIINGAHPRGASIAFITVQRITVLLNPRAGTQDDAAAARVSEAFRRAGGGEPDIRIVEGPSVRAAASDALARGSTILVAGGGDGTVSSVASTIVGRDAALGILPLGTLNHFAKDIGVPLDLDDAIRTVAAGRLVRVDVADVNGHPFINNASIGMYASLIAERHAMQRLGRRKWFAHGLAAARVWRRYHRLHVVLGVDGGDERAVRTPFVFVGNNEYQLSGLELGGRTKLDAGRLHVCMAPGMPRHRVARMILAAIFGDVRELEGFESLTASEVALDGGTPRLRASLDGEVIALDNRLTFRIRPRVLPVIVP
jgi:diacylglycerol kinase family enzyme